MGEQSSGFWTSIQGIFTGIAAVITAITGLYIAINSGDSGSETALTKQTAITTQIPTNTGTIAAKSVAVPHQLTSENVINNVTSAPQEKRNSPFPKAGPLVDCTLFPTSSSVRSLMRYAKHYHEQIITAEGETSSASRPCNKTIDYLGQAHCKAPYDAKVRRALLATLTLCRAAGIEWQDIEHEIVYRR